MLEVATPLASVCWVSESVPVLWKVPLAPLFGAVKVIVWLAWWIGLLYWSASWTLSGKVKAVLTVVCWLLPLTRTILDRSPAVLVTTNLACVVTPGVLAVTVYGPPARVLT